jgi:hypothetical protein
MTPESNIFPIYIKLVEQRGNKTELLMEEIKNLSIRFDISEDVKFVRLLPSTSNSNENSIVYLINTNPISHSPKAMRTISFLSYIFEKMFDKYPAYTEPS